VKFVTRLLRLIRINYVIVRYNLDEILFTTPWFYPLRFLSYFNPWYWLLRNKLTRGERLRRALEDLGPIFVKAGQLLSTRRDFLPEDIADELSKLQDRVPPFPGKQARQIIETALGCPIENVFSELQIEALASASIAQVHAAVLKNGKSAVVKVLRPGIKTIIDRDLDLLAVFAGLAERYWRQARGLKPRELVTEIAQTLHDELDLMREGANATQLRRNFAGSEKLYVPEIYWPYCRSNILVMERIEGIPIHNVEELKRTGVNLKKLAETGIEVFFTQIFRDSYFHADLHPGNIFVSLKDLENPQYIVVDFGIVGSLTAMDQRYIAENMLAFFKRDYQRVAELHVASGWLPPDTRIDQFEGAIRGVSEPIFDRPLKDISFGQLLLHLFQVARRFHINIQPQLILLQKTLLSIEGLSRNLSPDLDLWGSAAPHLERWLKRQVGLRGFLRRVRDNLPLWSEQIPDFPSLVYEVFHETRQEQETNRFARTKGVTKEEGKPHNNGMRYFLCGVGCTLIFSGAVFSLLMHVDIRSVIATIGTGLGLLLVANVM